MKSPLARDLKPNEIATAVFLVHTKEIRQKRTGEPYLSMLLADRTGEIDAKMWDNVADVMDTFDRDDFVKVKGLFQLYNNRPQFTIHKIRPVQDHEVDFSDFFPASLRNPDEMFAELRSIVHSLSNQHITRLLDAFLDDPEIAERYRIAPAAKSIHHAFRSGLLEHVLSLCGLARATATHYRTVDYDLLIAGVVLHDIGKIYELSYDRGFSYTADGQLLGHIAIAIRMLAEKFHGLPDFPRELRNLIEHMVLSHHGLLEYGSPKVPIFPEALLLHYIDDLDSKMECMRAMVDKEPQSTGLFTGYSSSMERVALRKARYLEVQPPVCEPSREPLEAGSAAGLANAHTDNGHAGPDGNGPEPAFKVQFHSGGAHFAQPKPQHAPAAGSFFGSKLQQALNDERK